MLNLADMQDDFTHGAFLVVVAGVVGLASLLFVGIGWLIIVGAAMTLSWVGAPEWLLAGMGQIGDFLGGPTVTICAIAAPIALTTYGRLIRRFGFSLNGDH